jgi:hypothetical protein
MKISYFFLLDFIVLVIPGEWTQITEFLITVFSLLLLLPVPLGPNILNNTLFANTMFCHKSSRFTHIKKLHEIIGLNNHNLVLYDWQHVSWLTDHHSQYNLNLNYDYVQRKLQRGLNSMVVWCERWIIKSKENKTRATYFSQEIKPPDSLAAETYLLISSRYACSFPSSVHLQLHNKIV